MDDAVVSAVVYPGWVWDWVGTGRGYTGTLPDHPRDPYLHIFRAKDPTHGQMKAFLRYIDEVSEIGSRIDQD